MLKRRASWHRICCQPAAQPQVVSMAVFSAGTGMLCFCNHQLMAALSQGPEFMLTWQTGDSNLSGCEETRERQERHVWLKGLAEAATCQVGPDKSPGPLQVRGAGAVRPLQMLRERLMCHKQELTLLDYSWRLCDPSTPRCSGGLQARQPPQLSPQLFGRTAE